MFQWLTKWAGHYAPSPEKLAEKALVDLRLELFRAEQQVLDAQLHAEYYRARIKFFEEVKIGGIDHVAEQRATLRGQVSGSFLRPKLATSRT